jgi:hypothetical protein
MPWNDGNYLELDWLSSSNVLDLTCVPYPCYLGLDILSNSSVLGLQFVDEELQVVVVDFLSPFGLPGLSEWEVVFIPLVVEGSYVW